LWNPQLNEDHRLVLAVFDPVDITESNRLIARRIFFGPWKRSAHHEDGRASLKAVTIQIMPKSRNPRKMSPVILTPGDPSRDSDYHQDA
jgi:hypothetical protein